MKKAFTLIEIVIVLVIISILMAAVMRFGSNRIVDLKAQSNKEQFIWYYNDLYNQNMTSSSRDGQRYHQMVVVMETWISYILDSWAMMGNTLPNIQIQNLRLTSWGTSLPIALLFFVPYQLGCDISDGSVTWDALYFDLKIPQNGKQYCFEIKSETCKLIETRCAD